MKTEEVKKLFIETCHIVGKLKHENDELKNKLDLACEAIKLLADRPDEKCGICKFKYEACIDCTFVYEHCDWYKREGKIDE